jgi:hypothetical protein
MGPLRPLCGSASASSPAPTRPAAVSVPAPAPAAPLPLPTPYSCRMYARCRIFSSVAAVAAVAVRLVLARLGDKRRFWTAGDVRRHWRVSTWRDSALQLADNKIELLLGEHPLVLRDVTVHFFGCSPVASTFTSGGKITATTRPVHELCRAPPSPRRVHLDRTRRSSPDEDQQRSQKRKLSMVPRHLLY